MKRAVLLGVVALLAAAAPVAGQRGIRQPRPVDPSHQQLLTELGRLREAATKETSGDLAGAETIVREVLEANPTSLSALLTLERLLGQQGRLAEVVPMVERLLEREPTSVIGHQTRLRLFVDMNETRRLDDAVVEWIRATPDLETPYREAAAAYRRLGEAAKAVAVLEQGRKKVQREDGLALELGDAYLNNSDVERAAAEWSRAVGPDGRGFLLVQRRVQSLADGGARVIPALVRQLSGEPITPARQRAAALLAIDAGLEQQAQRLSKDLAATVDLSEREALLVELARRSDGAGLHRLAAWAYGEMLRDEQDFGPSLAIRSRIAELALLAGDTALAAATYRELESAAAVGSPQRRQAVALRIQLGARNDAAAAAQELAGFRSEFPQAPELDETASVVAEALMVAGDLAAAERVLTGVRGAAASRLRGRLFLRRGNIAAAREELLGAAPLLRGTEATETIALAALLTRVSAEGAELVASIVGAPEAERGDRISAAAASARMLPERDRAAVLDFLAGTAERSGLMEDADALRREIVSTLPRTAEAPAALLALARRLTAQPEAVEEAKVLLEKLILEYPRSALAPQARNELQRLHTRSTG